MADERRLRQATGDDIPVLVRHRRCMAAEIARSRGLLVDTAGLEVGMAVYPDYLRVHMADGTVVAWVIECGDGVLSSGSLTLCPMPPGAGDRSLEEARVGFLHSIYTEPQHRGRGCATRIVQAAIECGRGLGLKRIDLGASEAGRPIYESLGFKPATTMMQLRLR